jgi:Tol biopolymer transport system component/DNA-binding winged helix-turn-helix (wHTH) protein
MPEPTQPELRGTVRFGDYELDPRRGVLMRGGVPLKIQPQPFRVLELLVSRAPGVVTREELSESVWGNGVNVDLDQSLNFCVRQIRSVLNDSASNPRFIYTLPKQGYRFIREVVRDELLLTTDASIVPPDEPRHEAVTDMPKGTGRRAFLWSGVAAIAAVVGEGIWFGESLRRRTPSKAVNVVIPLPEGATNADSLRVVGPAVISPDGNTIAISLTTAEVNHIYLRALDSNRLVRLEGTEHASTLFWSPDGQYIGFAAEASIKRVPAIGGSSIVLCNALDARGGAWNRDGDIIFGSGYQCIFRVSASGGQATPVTQMDEIGGENSHWFPVFLPDGKRFLYYVKAYDVDKRGVYLGSLDHRQSKRRLIVADGSFALALDPKSKTYYLMSEQGGKIAAQVLDVDRGELVGPPHILLERPGMISVSDTGVLMIRRFGQELSRLVWRDRTGRELGMLKPPGNYAGVHLSPDGRFVVVTREDPISGQSKIWIAALPDGLFEPFSDSNRAKNPNWSDDSGYVYYNDDHRGVLLRRQVSPRGEEEMVIQTNVSHRTHVDSISPDGRYAVAELITDNANAEAVWTKLIGENKTGTQWHSINAPGREGMLPCFSPDGKWMAFSSNNTGTPEVYVIDFPEASQRLRVSADGGYKPRWRRDGKELFYLAADGSMMVAQIELSKGRITTQSQRLFDANLKIHTNYDANYAVTSDGQRFLGIARELPSGDSDIQMVLNWPSLLPQ